MDERLKEVEKFLDGDNKEAEAILGKLNKLRPHERIEWLQDWTQKADKIYNGAPELKPRDLQRLIDKFKKFNNQAEEDPSQLEVDFRTIIENHNYNEGDSFIKLLEDLDKKSNGNLDKVTGNFNDWMEKPSPKGWQGRINKLTFLKELYPIWENISEILNRENNNFKNPKNIAKSISSKGSSNWEEEVIATYLSTYSLNKNESAEGVRKLAIERAKAKRIKKDLAKVEASTLYTWRKKIKA